MKARVWKDRVTGAWRFQVTALGMLTGGEQMTWRAAADEALTILRWVHGHHATYGNGRDWVPVSS